jgi:hypothetical protein
MKLFILCWNNWNFLQVVTYFVSTDHGGTTRTKKTRSEIENEGRIRGDGLPSGER